MYLSVSDTDYTPWKNIFSAEECLKCRTITHVLRWPQQKVQLKMKLIKNAGRNLMKCRTRMKKDGCLSEFQGALQSSLCVQQPCADPQPCSGSEIPQLQCLARNCSKPWSTAKMPHQRAFTCVTAAHAPNTFCETFKHSQLWQIVSNFAQYKADAAPSQVLSHRSVKAPAGPAMAAHPAELDQDCSLLGEVFSVGFWWGEFLLFSYPHTFNSSWKLLHSVRKKNHPGQRPSWECFSLKMTVSQNNEHLNTVLES